MTQEDLDSYLKLEDQVGAGLAWLIPKMLPEGVGDPNKETVDPSEDQADSWDKTGVKMGSADRATPSDVGELPNLGSKETVLGDLEEMGKWAQRALVSNNSRRSTGAAELKLSRGWHSCQEELACMELAHFCIRQMMMTISADVQGLHAALQWTEKNLHDTLNTQDKDELAFRLVSLRKELHFFQRDIKWLQVQYLGPLLWADVSLIRLPILQGDLELEAAHLRQVTQAQEQVKGQLLGQHARLDLLELWLSMELQEQNQVEHNLKELLEGLRGWQSEPQRRLTRVGDHPWEGKPSPHLERGSGGQTSYRLWEILEGHKEPQFFHSYGTIAARSTHLQQEVRILRQHLAIPPSHLFTLETDCKALYGVLYNEFKQLLLRPKVITESLDSLSLSMNDLSQLLAKVMENLRTKRKSSQNPLQQMEHSLYVPFFLEVGLLRETIEQLEKQASLLVIHQGETQSAPIHGVDLTPWTDLACRPQTPQQSNQGRRVNWEELNKR
ncbi:HAUS augmin-like complex subunit 3 [Tachyglossus aculeatus]|uniref:HAUS augmin-like complex subunit 3 n=1 Tax=Tachyglossus aculeatus TaxID=9261 RepID=UPI0018F7B4D1|nr:HAUS augmin-like complex subunit 3 [Tachyglossus aculeatus]